MGLTRQERIDLERVLDRVMRRAPHGLCGDRTLTNQRRIEMYRACAPGDERAEALERMFGYQRRAGRVGPDYGLCASDLGNLLMPFTAPQASGLSRQQRIDLERVLDRVPAEVRVDDGGATNRDRVALYRASEPGDARAARLEDTFLFLWLRGAGRGWYELPAAWLMDLLGPFNL